MWGKHCQEDMLACRSWLALLVRTRQSRTDRCWEKKGNSVSGRVYFSFRLQSRWKGCLATLTLWAVSCGLVLAGTLQVWWLQPSARSARSLCNLCSELWTLTGFEEGKKQQRQGLFVSLKGSTVLPGWHSQLTTCSPFVWDCLTAPTHGLPGASLHAGERCWVPPATWGQLRKQPLEITWWRGLSVGPPLHVVHPWGASGEHILVPDWFMTPVT